MNLLEHQDESLPCDINVGTNFIWEDNKLPELHLLCCFEPQQASRLIASTCLNQDERGECCWKSIVATAPYIMFMQIQRGAQPLCLSPHKISMTTLHPCFQICLGVCVYSSHIFTPASTSHHYFTFTGGAEPPYLPPPDISGSRLSLPPATPRPVLKLCEVINNFVNHALLVLQLC